MKKKVVKRAPKKRYVIVRTYSAGVFAGTLESRKGREVVLTEANLVLDGRGEFVPIGYGGHE